MFNIALNTFKEIVRNKFLYLILFFAFAFIAFSISLGKLTIWDDNKIIVDFGLAMIEIFWIIWVLFVWSQLLFKEVEWKTIFLILSKPIKRYEFILGKFLGFSATIFLIILFQSLLFLWILYLKDIEITKIIVVSLFFTYLKLEILLVLVFFFSSFMSNIMTILISLMVYLIGHSFSLLIDMALRLKNQILLKTMEVINVFFPPLEALNTKNYIWSPKYISNLFLAENTIYALVFVSILLYFTVLIFSRKEFE